MGVLTGDVLAFFPILVGKLLASHHYVDGSSRCLKILVIVLRKFPSLPSLLRVVIMEECWAFSNAFSVHLL